MKFLWTTLYVKDLDASIAFYSDLVGLKAKRRFPAGPGREIAFMGDGEDGETVIELLRDENGAPRPYGEGVSIGFRADSVEAMLGKVSSLGIPVYEGPVDTPGFSYFIVKDPDGMSVQFFRYKDDQAS